ncbi:MAG: LPS assembly protein LptD [Desulfobacterota bacterium]|nr:LPS assembly protein LptD [Thermodesulfobacteriota bacterium]
MKSNGAIAFLLFLVLFTISPAEGKIAEKRVGREEGPVDIEADELSYDRDRQIYEAHGRVEVRRGTLFLRADHAQLQMATKDLVAWGNIVLREGEDVLECERLEINLDTRLGRIYQARLFLKEQNFHITGKEAVKLGENRYRLIEGSFTTCDAPRPPWKFTVKELEVTIEGYGVAKAPTFYLEGVPSLYLPWAIFPVKRERQTGFLLPQVGYSEKYGPEVKTAFFWAMTKDMDSTIYLDYLGERGVKGGIEYRYAFAPETSGKANFFFIDDQVLEKNRYAFFLQGQQKLPQGFYARGDVNWLSDIRYQRDFDEDLPGEAKIDARSRRQLRSTLFGGKNWDGFSFLTEGSVYQDLTQESNDETLQRLPQVGFYALPQSLIQTPLFVEGVFTYNHFWREKGVKAHRWDLFPRFLFPLRLFNVLKVEPSLGLRETLYRPFDDPTRRYQGWESRETFVAQMEVSAEIYRVYEADLIGGLLDLFPVGKWMHTIEPMIRYGYSPRVTQKNIPLFDDIDRVPYVNQITYGVIQKFIGRSAEAKANAGAWEYARLEIFQSYSFGDPFERDSRGRKRSFSNIRGELWWQFSPYLSGRIDGEFDPYDGHFDTGNVSLTLQDRREDLLSVQYRYGRSQLEELSAGVRIKVRPTLYLFGSTRYNLKDGWKVENLYGAEYRAQCWTLGLMVEDKGESPDKKQRKEVKVQAYLNLLGLGSLGKRPSLMGL